MSDIIYLSNARLSFPQLVEPRASTEGAKPKYAADFILPPNHPGVQQFMQVYAKLAADKWAEHAQNVMAMIQQDRKLRCFGQGSEKIDKKTFKPYSGYEGMVYLSANKDVPPQMIESSGRPIDANNTMLYQQMARKMYGGCYVNAALRPWVQDNKHGRGVRCDLVAIQFAADGEAFGESEPDVTPFFGAVAAPQQEAAPAAPFGFPGFITQ